MSGTEPMFAAAHGCIAVVRPLLAVPHLDRDFEYTIPEDMAQDVRFGVLVKVRFGGQDVSGYVVDVRDTAEHTGQLRPLRRLVSPQPVLTEEIWRLAEAVAAHQAGTVSDVLRLAVPSRHAGAEKALDQREPEPLPRGPWCPPVDGLWERYAGGRALLQHLHAGHAPGAAWTAAPGMPAGRQWPDAVSDLVGATRAAGRGSLVIVPDARDVDRVVASLEARLGRAGIARLTADQGPQARYTAFLRTLRGHADIVVGTRAAMFAPVRDLGLALWWDDADTLHAEPRAPYPHVREVLRLRAQLEAASLVCGGWTRSIPVQQWVDQSVLRPVEPLVRSNARVAVTGGERSLEREGPAAAARIPSEAWRGARDALTRGPVLVQVPRRGYIPALACARCRTKATCDVCHGPLGADEAGSPPQCRWCGHVAHVVTCPECGAHELRSLVVGAGRTAEELGRAFPGVPVRRSGAPDVLATVPDEPALVIATPGAEPVAEGGYAAALLLDAWALLDRAGLETGTRALDHWMAAAALVRPMADGGVVYLSGVPRHTPFPAVEALVRWAPAWFAARELAERAEVALPPVTRMAALEGPRRAASEAAEEVTAAAADTGLDLVVLGPLPLGRRHAFDRVSGGPGGAGGDEEPPVRYLVRWADPYDPGPPRLFRNLRAQRSAHRREAVTVRLDPPLDGTG